MGCHSSKRFVARLIAAGWKHAGTQSGHDVYEYRWMRPFLSLRVLVSHEEKTFGHAVAAARARQLWLNGQDFEKFMAGKITAAEFRMNVGRISVGTGTAIIPRERDGRNSNANARTRTT